VNFEDGDLGSNAGQLSRWLSMAGVIAAKKLRPEIVARVVRGQCLCCHRKAARRGLCQSCYRFFVLAMAKLPTTKRPGFEEDQIRDGKILAVGQVKEIRYPNPFGPGNWPKAKELPSDEPASA
jgi:hypothetical protein